MRRALICGVAALAAATVSAQTLRLERTVVLMRHGVRPPTKSPPMPEGIAAAPWPAWPVPPGHLTPHGAEGVRRLAGWDRARLVGAGLLPARGCPPPASVALASDSDQRTIATGEVYAAGLVPGCPIANDHRPEGAPDTLFATAGEGDAVLDAGRADAAVTAALGPGGIAGQEAALRPALARVDQILCGGERPTCGVAREPSAVTPATRNKRPKLSGALDLGSTAAQILLLEYADGKPMAEVGWGRATAADIRLASALHAAEFAIVARPLHLAARNVEPIARAMLAGLAPGAPRVTAIVGHDTNVAAMGGLLDLHWQVPGYAADDPAPGGALLFDQLRDHAGGRFIRIRYRAQTLGQLRALTPLGAQARAYDQLLTAAGCARLCPATQFQKLVERALAK